MALRTDALTPTILNNMHTQKLGFLFLQLFVVTSRVHVYVVAHTSLNTAYAFSCLVQLSLYQNY